MGRSRRRDSPSDDRDALTTEILIVGVGPSGFDQLPDDVQAILLNPQHHVIARTLEHPALAQLAEQRLVESGDDLYRTSETFEQVYDALAQRVVDAAQGRTVVYAVPGSATVGELSVPLVVERAEQLGVRTRTLAGESFVDAVCRVAGIDPLAHGLQVLDGRNLPNPLPLHVPTIIGQVDVPVVAADVLSRLGDLIGEHGSITVVTDAGGHDQAVTTAPVSQLDHSIASLRTSLVVPAQPSGWLGAIDIMRRLRTDCPWDAEQTHHSLVTNLTEEAAELADALVGLGPDAPDGNVDFGAYADVEEELGDVLLQVLFHIAMAEPSGALSPDGVGTVLIDKLVRRHPHVFADVEATDAAGVHAIWDKVKAAEKSRDSVFDGVARSLTPLAKAEKVQSRAANVGFDWPDAAPVYAKLQEEIAELAQAETASEREAELGDVLFTVVNLARKLGIGAEVALRRTVERFQQRVEWMEQQADLADESPDRLEELWEQAKDEEE